MKRYSSRKIKSNEGLKYTSVFLNFISKPSVWFIALLIFIFFVLRNKFFPGSKKNSIDNGNGNQTTYNDPVFTVVNTSGATVDDQETIQKVQDLKNYLNQNPTDSTSILKVFSNCSAQDVDKIFSTFGIQLIYTGNQAKFLSWFYPPIAMNLADALKYNLDDDTYNTMKISTFVNSDCYKMFK